MSCPECCSENVEKEFNDRMSTLGEYELTNCACLDCGCEWDEAWERKITKHGKDSS